jgi:hypothetical protein
MMVRTARASKAKKGKSVVEPSETLTVTFLYDHTQGVFHGVLPNGVRFSFIAAPDSPLPTKLRNALQGLMAKAHTAFRATTKPHDPSDEAWELTLAKIKEFEERNGVTRSARKAVKRKAPRISNLSLEDLDL